MAFITMEGAKASFNLFCCAYGIGTLSILGNFSRAGPVLGIIGMAFMAFAASTALRLFCRVMLLVRRPGEWVLGKTGRYLTVVVQWQTV
ncbi:hypothetical protein GQ600_22641 [Phytophthora cactorum]|nr:hypothetical protein GQ600_22641 [Phytophthora cactorum]